MDMITVERDCKRIYLNHCKKTVTKNKKMDNFSPEQAEQALQQAKMQIAQQQTQLLVSTITGKCFDKCVSSPSSSLSKREETCLAMCYDKFIQVQQVVIKSMS